jgi:hypothetical protein
VNNYYTYSYLREDGTPYYIGKGKNKRAYSKSSRYVQVPKDKDRILFLKQNLTEDEAFKHEKYMIHVLGRKDLGTGILRNLTEGGEGSSGCIPSEDTRLKMRESQIGKTLSETHRKRIGESRRGICHSEESKRKMSMAHKGKIISEETKKKMSGARLGEKNHFYGKQHSEETKRKMMDKTISENHRKKISEANKGKIWINDGIKTKMISSNHEIPIGFVPGRIKKGNKKSDECHSWTH